MKKFLITILFSASLIGMQNEHNNRMAIDFLLNPLPKTPMQPTAAASLTDEQKGALPIYIEFQLTPNNLVSIVKKTNKSKYPSHIDSDGKRIYTCIHEGCTYTTIYTDSFVTHQRVHSDEKPFKCSQVGCNFATKWESSFANHIRVHTGEKPYRCMMCKSTFRAYYIAKCHVCAAHNIAPCEVHSKIVKLSSKHRAERCKP